MDDQKLNDLGVRTMESDKNSITEQGGGAPKPYTPSMNASQPEPERTAPEGENVPADLGRVPSSMPVAAPGPSVNPPSDGYMPPTGGSTPTSLGGSPKQPVPPEDLNGMPKKKSMFPVLVGLIAVLVIGAVVYFFIIPALSGGETETPAVSESLPQESDTQQPGGEPTIPAGASDALVPPAETTEVPTSTEPEAPAETPAAPSHLSLFGTPPDSTQDVVITGAEQPAGLLQRLMLAETQVPLFREIVLMDDNGNFVPFASIATRFAPNVFTTEVGDYFQPDATYYTYTDDSGTWFGLAAQLKSDVDLQTAKSAVAAFESQLADIKRFFSADVGDPSAWKDGGAGSVTGRYVTFGETNAAFNYGWSGRTLLIATSYNAYKGAANRL